MRWDKRSYQTSIVTILFTALKRIITLRARKGATCYSLRHGSLVIISSNAGLNKVSPEIRQCLNADPMG